MTSSRRDGPVRRLFRELGVLRALVSGKAPDPDSPGYAAAGRVMATQAGRVWQVRYIAWHMRRPWCWIPEGWDMATFWALHGGPPGLWRAIQAEHRRRQAPLN